MNTAVLVAGGTGGHINAALALGEILKDEGFQIDYFTGKRPLDYQLFQELKSTISQQVFHLNSKPLRSKNPLIILRNGVFNVISFLWVFFHFMKRRPLFAVGAGGYVCGPTLLAAFLLRIPVFIIEQNAVMGLTNRILSKISTRIFVHFSRTLGCSSSMQNKIIVVGNPTRKSIIPVPRKKFDGKLKVLIFGGSLGALQINKVIDELLGSLKGINIEFHHQRGASTNDHLAQSKNKSMDQEIQYQAMEYISNIQQEYEWCDVIISRAGASTISELAVIKKPVLLFPYPQATDNHQVHNARHLKEEADFSVEILDPSMSFQECVRRTEEFLFKAYRQELKYSEKPSSGNDSCQKILREIKRYVGLA